VGLTKSLYALIECDVVLGINLF